MEYGSGSGYPATSGGDNQNNGSRMQQTDRQQQSGLAYHHVPHQMNQGKEFSASILRYNLSILDEVSRKQIYKYHIL